MPSSNGVYSLPPGYLAATGTTEQPKDEPMVSVPFVDGYGRQMIDGRGNLIVSSKSTLVDSSLAVEHHHIEKDIK
jgi:hypothetical protein